MSQRTHRHNFEIRHEPRLFGVGAGNDDAAVAPTRGRHCDGEHATRCTHPAVESEFTDDHGALQCGRGKALICREHRKRDRQVKTGTDFG